MSLQILATKGVWGAGGEGVSVSRVGMSQKWACPKSGHVPRMGLSQGYVQRVGLSKEWACPSPAPSRHTITTFTTFNLSLFNLGEPSFQVLEPIRIGRNE